MRRAFFVILASIALVSCGKDGPRGPRGPQGTPGKDGTQINTYYFDVFPDQWKSNGTYGSAGYYCYEERTLAALTSSVINSGAVLAYVIFDDTYDHQLPYIEPFHDNGYYIRTIRYDLQPGKIGFIVEDSDFKTVRPPYSGGKVQFKVVIISKI
jgi:hypothetical protein